MSGIAESHDTHTRLMRFGLGIDESRAYWAQMRDRDDPPRAEHAFERHWFGTVSEKRVHTILSNMAVRYDAYPDALAVLSRWRDMDPATRRNIVHWHLQLADPTYRDFTADFLITRREAFRPELYRDVVIRWLEEKHPGRWAISSRKELATRLLGAARAAGLLAGKTDPRTLEFPRVTDEALGYGLRLFRSIEVSGTFLDNAYLRSVGLWGSFLSDRVGGLPDLSVRVQGDLVEFESDTPDLRSWWEATAA